MAVSPPWSGWEVPTSIHHASWADDYVHLQIAKTGDALLHHVVASAKVHVENASSVGMQLTFAVDKSAVLLSARVARTVAGPLCRDASGTLGFVVQDDVMGEHHFLPVVDSYRHLGGILTANGSPETDIAFRMAQANSTLRPLKRRLFKSQGIPLTVRCTLLRSLVISRFVFACATVDLHAAVHRRKWCRAYINCWRALCKHSWGDKPMRPMHCYHVLLHTGATSPLLAMVQARSTFLQRILRHGPAGLLHLLHVRWVHKVSDSWLVQLVQDLRGVAPYSSSARIVLDSPHPVREFIETFQSEPEWWRQQLRKAVKGFEQDLRDWQRQPSPSEDAKNVVEAGAQKKQAYRPPKARGETQNTVAQMMRGEVAAPEDDRRTRKTRQQRPKDEEAAGQDDSKEDGQTDSPPSRPPPPEAPPPPAARAQQAQAQQQAQQAQQQVQQAQQQAQQREAQAREAQRMREMQNAAKAANAAQLDRQRQLQEAQEAAQEQIVRDMLNLQRSAGYGGGADAAAALRLQAAHNAAQAKAMVQQRQQQQQREQALLLGASTQQELARRMQLYEQAQQAQNGMQLLEENAARLQEQRQRQQHEAKKLAQAQQMAAGHQRQQQQQQQQMQSMGASAHGQKQACPATGWQYIDPKNQIQGPFSLLEMQQWYHMNYFRPELKMRCSEQDDSRDFVPFSELFPHPMVPFQSYPKRVPSGGRR
eukprot:s504_g12.t1